MVAVLLNVLAHSPVPGVNVNVAVLPEVLTDQLPAMPLSEVVGSAEAAGTEPAQYLSFREAKVGVTIGVTVTSTLRVSVAVQEPLVAVTLTVYVVVADGFTVTELPVPTLLPSAVHTYS